MWNLFQQISTYPVLSTGWRACHFKSKIFKSILQLRSYMYWSRFQIDSWGPLPLQGSFWVWTEPMRDGATCNIVFHGLKPYPERSLHCDIVIDNKWPKIVTIYLIIYLILCWANSKAYWSPIRVALYSINVGHHLKTFQVTPHASESKVILMSLRR